MKIKIQKQDDYTERIACSTMEWACGYKDEVISRWDSERQRRVYGYADGDEFEVIEVFGDSPSNRFFKCLSEDGKILDIRECNCLIVDNSPIVNPFDKQDVDWEERTWDLAGRLYSMGGEEMSAKNAVECAKALVEEYKNQMSNDNNV